MTEERVVVEVDLGVESDNRLLGRDDERIDLHERAVVFHEQPVEVLDHGRKALDRCRRQIEPEGELPAVVALKPEQRIDKNLDDLLRSLGSYVLNVHAAGLAGHNDDFGRRSVGNDAEIKFLGNVQPLLHQQLAHQASLRAGLMGDEGHAEDLAGHRVHFRSRAGELDSSALAPPPGMDLGLDDHRPAVQAGRDLLGLVDAEGNPTFRHRDAVFLEQLLCLIFVDFHFSIPPPPERRLSSPNHRC